MNFTCEDCLHKEVCDMFNYRTDPNECDKFKYMGDYMEIKTGHWIREYIGFGTYRYKCSRCGAVFGHDQITEFARGMYCGECGSKMKDA